MIKVINESDPTYGQRRYRINKIISAAKKALIKSNGEYTSIEYLVPTDYDTNEFWKEFTQVMKNQGINASNSPVDDNENGLIYQIGLELFGTGQKWFKNGVNESASMTDVAAAKKNAELAIHIWNTGGDDFTMEITEEQDTSEFWKVFRKTLSAEGISYSADEKSSMYSHEYYITLWD